MAKWHSAQYRQPLSQQVFPWPINAANTVTRRSCEQAERDDHLASRRYHATIMCLGSRYLMLKLTRLYSSHNGVLLCTLRSRIRDLTRYVYDNMCGGLSECGR